MSKELAHKGDPCVYCNTPHDDVEPGNCPGLEVIPTTFRTDALELAEAVRAEDGRNSISYTATITEEMLDLADRILKPKGG